MKGPGLWSEDDVIEETLAVLKRLYPGEEISAKKRGPDIPVRLKGGVSFLVDCKGSQPLDRAGNHKPDRAAGQMIRYYERYSLPIFTVVPDDWKRPRAQGETGEPWKSQVERLFEFVGVQRDVYVVTVPEIQAKRFSFEGYMKKAAAINGGQSGPRRHVWYAGYGSNTLAERFLCYIKGGQFRLGGTPLKPCTDETPPTSTSDFVIQHRMYFANHSKGWKRGGTALLDPTPTTDESEFTRARLWKVTWEQFREIWEKEGKTKHDIILHLRKHPDHCDIATFTSSRKLDPTRPSDGYIRTIVLGLRETFVFSDRQTTDYLLGLEGIKGVIPATKLEAVVRSAGNL
jgi:hypothetical protein